MLADPGRSPRYGFAPRALLTLTGVPAVAFVVSILVPAVGGPTTTVLVRLLVFAATTLGFLRVVALRTGCKHYDVQDAAILAAGACLGVLAELPIPNPLPTPSSVMLIAVVTAIVEEYIFRRRLPALLGELLKLAGPPRIVLPLSVILAQAAFATCHFVTAGHFAPFGQGLPIMRLFAAGSFLAVIVAYGGLPVAIFVHAATNVLIQTGVAGRFHVPTSHVILSYSALAIVCVWSAAWSQHISHRSSGQAAAGSAAK